MEQKLSELKNIKTTGHKTKIRATSLATFADILGQLSQREIQVFQAIKQLRTCNNLMISKEVHLPINCVTGRTNSLKKYGLIRVLKRDICPFIGRLTDFYRIPEWINGVL